MLAQYQIISRAFGRNYLILDKTRVKLLSYFTSKLLSNRPHGFKTTFVKSYWFWIVTVVIIIDFSEHRLNK